VFVVRPVLPRLLLLAAIAKYVHPRKQGRKDCCCTYRRGAAAFVLKGISVLGRSSSTTLAKFDSFESGEGCKATH